jgi:plastocyanin
VTTRSSSNVVAAALALAALALSSCTPALGRIRGTVPPARVPTAVVQAWPADGASPPLAHKIVRIEQTARGFVPAVTVERAGTTIEFHNDDHVFHGAFSRMPAAPFDLKPSAPGKGARVRLLEPGEYPVFCELHPKESATILVTPDRWHRRPDESGRFTLRSVPRGKYRVRVWNPNKKDLERTVEVKPGETAEVEFTP